MAHEEQNEQRCPLYNQTGAHAIKDFAAILRRLTPELRAAYEAERQQRQAELEAYATR